MDGQTKKILISVVLIVVAAIIYYRSSICECKTRIDYSDVFLNRDINLDSLFLQAGDEELSDIITQWENFNLQSDSFHIIKEDYYSQSRKLIVIENYHAGLKHYGAVIFPYQFDESKKYPLLLWANGLQQSNPSVEIFKNPNAKTLFGSLKDYFIAVPSYRGQALVTPDERYCSDGFFGDAFDGATNDALRLTELAKNEFPSVDKGRIAVYGESRGGTVALLMASRDSTVHAVASAAGPTNFFSKDVLGRYGFQFRYQFLSQNAPEKELRAKMIKSSPAYFIDRYPNALLLIHGKFDQTVPVSNAEVIIDKLREKENFEVYITNGGHQFYDMKKVADWLTENN